MHKTLAVVLWGLRPEDSFRPHRLWQLPSTGLHDYALPETIAERIYSSRSTPHEEMARAVLASAAISALVLPLRVGETIGTDGGRVRNFPLGHADDNPDVHEIVGFRYVSHTPPTSPENLVRLRRRLEPFRAVPSVRALIGELRAAEERLERGEPPHLADMIVRLMRIAIARNTELETRSADGIDASVREREALRDDVDSRGRPYPSGTRPSVTESVSRSPSARTTVSSIVSPGS